MTRMRSQSHIDAFLFSMLPPGEYVFGTNDLH